MKATYQLGFQSQEQELANTGLPVQGNIPEWLEGTLVRNCPSKFDFQQGSSVNHWFDGLSMLHKFAFGAGRVTYSCRFLKCKAYEMAQAKGRLCSREFATDPDMSLWQRAAAIFQQEFTDNANVNVARIAGAHVALTETPIPIEFCPETLATKGHFQFEDSLSGQITTAHPHFDCSQNCWFNLLTHISASSTYQLYRLNNGSRKRELLATLAVKEPAYMHSFAMSRRYIILAEFPLRLNPMALLFSGKPYIQNYSWRPAQATRLHVISKDNGKLVATMEHDSCFAFHHVNAFERGNEVVLDVLAYPDAAIVDTLRLPNLRQETCTLPSATLERIRLNLDSKSVARECLCDLSLELPRINYATVNGNDYSFAFSAGSSSTDNFLDQLVKIDLPAGKTKIWREDGCYPGEPVFIPHPSGGNEDNGVLISLVLDTRAKTSFLLILDASSMQERARLVLPHTVAFGFHGQFFPITK